MREHAEALKPVIGRMPAYLKLLWALARDPGLSRYSKGLLAAGALYSVSPIDLVPGFVPVVGQLDDLLVLFYALRQALRRLPEAEREQYLGAQGLTWANLEADIAATEQVLKAVAGRAARATGRALAWSARLAGRTALWGARQAVRTAGQGIRALEKRRRRKKGTGSGAGE